MLSIPPPSESALLSNSIVLNLSPIIGSKIHPLPLAPCKVIAEIPSTSKFCGSIRTSETEPEITGSTRADEPAPAVIVRCGGLITS